MIAPALDSALFLKAAEQLPTAPRLLVELGEIIRRPFVSSDEVVSRLRQDAGLAARILTVANSAVYARAEPVGSIEEAVAAIGFREVHRLVGAMASRQLADRPLNLYRISGPRLRENALFVAVVMEELAEEAGEDPRSCYTVGLLRSVGKMVLDQLGRGGEVEAFDAGGPALLAEWEVRNWGVTSCRVAELVLKHWNLPHETVIAVQHHFDPAGRHNPVIHLLTLAAAAAQDRYYGLVGEEVYLGVSPENFARAGLDQRHYQLACERAQRTFARLHAAVS